MPPPGRMNSFSAGRSALKPSSCCSSRSMSASWIIAMPGMHNSPPRSNRSCCTWVRTSRTSVGHAVAGQHHADRAVEFVGGAVGGDARRNPWPRGSRRRGRCCRRRRCGCRSWTGGCPCAWFGGGINAGTDRRAATGATTATPARAPRPQGRVHAVELEERQIPVAEIDEPGAEAARRRTCWRSARRTAVGDQVADARCTPAPAPPAQGGQRASPAGGRPATGQPRYSEP